MANKKKNQQKQNGKSKVADVDQFLVVSKSGNICSRQETIDEAIDDAKGLLSDEGGELFIYEMVPRKHIVSREPEIKSI